MTTATKSITDRLSILKEEAKKIKASKEYQAEVKARANEKKREYHAMTSEARALYYDLKEYGLLADIQKKITDMKAKKAVSK